MIDYQIILLSINVETQDTNLGIPKVKEVLHLEIDSGHKKNPKKLFIAIIITFTSVHVYGLIKMEYTFF